MSTTPGEPQLKLKAKDWFSVEGVQYRPGDIVSFPERLALGLVGAGAVDQLPPEQDPGAGATDPGPPGKSHVVPSFISEMDKPAPPTPHTGGLGTVPRPRRHEHEEGHK